MTKQAYPDLVSYWVIILSVLLLSAIQDGCSKSTRQLKDWVNERGYVFYPDYSTQNLLGSEVRGQRLRPNTYFQVTGTPGILPNFRENETYDVSVKGNAETVQMLDSLQITGSLQLAEEASITLSNPFNEVAKAFVPIGPCEGQEIRVVTTVLNTGTMKVEVKDKSGANITDQFTLPVGNVGTGIDAKARKATSFIGSGFYVGYHPENRQCVRIHEKLVRVQRGQPMLDNDVGIYAYYAAYDGSEYMRKALVFLSPSLYRGSRQSANVIQHNVDQYVQWAGSMKGNSLQASLTPWETATDVRGSHWDSGEKGGFILRHGDHLGLPARPGVSGNYIEVQDITDNTLALRIQLIEYRQISR
jgi:hypothetical protein